jgi:hypothetical protein
MTLTQISSSLLFILGFLLLGLGALVKRALENIEKCALIQREQEFTNAMEEWVRKDNGMRVTGAARAPHRENSRRTHAGAA